MAHGAQFLSFANQAQAVDHEHFIGCALHVYGGQARQVAQQGRNQRVLRIVPGGVRCCENSLQPVLGARKVGAKKGVVYRVVDAQDSNDKYIEMTVSPQARKKNPELPANWQVRAVTYEIAGKEKTVFTSLPKEQYSAKDVAALYHERWEIELGYRDIKSSMQHNAMTLRSKTVELVYQELWGLLLGYNLVRREASQAAVAHGRLPNEISFKYACQYIASQLRVMSKALSPGNTPKRLEALRGDLSMLFIEKRPRPSRPRAVKISKTRYPINHKASPLK